MLKRLISVVSLVFLALSAQAANWPDRPTLTAVRAPSPVTVDGDLSEEAWQSAPKFTDFTQHDPVDGAPSSQFTAVRILYDDEAIYFGAEMHDTHPPTTLLVRRDSFGPMDFLSINIDPQHDRLSGNAFTVNPSNVQVDTVLYNDIIEDGSWDGVWDSATRVTAEGWFAEVRVPFSQLRFPDKESHVWGLNITRRTARTNEIVRIVNTRKGDTGFVSHFADVVGLEGIRRGRPLELVPYALGRSDFRTRREPNNPFLEGQDQRFDGGLDVKYALTSSLTLTGTINPDFGQVEVDPAVVNLSEFETFYPEKRPFFTEGLNVFRFSDSPAPLHINFLVAPNLFYTRRIGRAPQAAPDADFSLAPAETTILGAAKVTGRLPGGWSLGVLDALTDTERARFADRDDVRSQRQHVEPMTNYFVSRVTKELGAGSRAGFMLNTVNRRLADELSSLRESSISGGVDGYTTFGSWVLEGMAMGSRVSGSARAIELTQTSSSRYYDRPDAGHVELDPARTSLTGWGTRAMISKTTGLWRPIAQVHAYSPGLETNDAGFMQRTDIISSHAMMMYFNENPSRWFRDRRAWFGSWQNRNFDGDTLERGGFVDASGTFSNYWPFQAALFVYPGSFSDRLTRGGPVVRTPTGWDANAGIGNDNRKRFSWYLSSAFSGSEDDSYSRSVTLQLTARPRPNVSLSLAPSFSQSMTAHQFVDRFDDTGATLTYGRRYVFANLDQRSFELGTRADWTLSPRLSFQLYLQPFVASGDYHDAHTLVAPRTRDYEPYALAAGDEPDFNFRSVRGSAVLRWEFRPGSALFVVWSENRADTVEVGDFSLRRDLRAIPTAPSHDVFLVKVSYWLPM